MTSMNGRADDPAAVAALQRELADRLLALRGQFQEAVANFSVRVQGELAHLGDGLLDDPSSLGADDRAERLRALRAAIEELEKVDLKPSKGRRKDLRRVDRLTRSLRGRLADI